jgi:hypothetical protein
MVAHLLRSMQANDAPEEQYHRLGLDVPAGVGNREN